MRVHMSTHSYKTLIVMGAVVGLLFSTFIVQIERHTSTIKNINEKGIYLAEDSNIACNPFSNPKITCAPKNYNYRTMHTLSSSNISKPSILPPNKEKMLQVRQLRIENTLKELVVQVETMQKDQTARAQ